MILKKTACTHIHRVFVYGCLHISVQHLDYIIIHCVQETRHFRETVLQATNVTTMQELSIANLQTIQDMEVKFGTHTYFSVHQQVGL